MSRSPLLRWISAVGIWIFSLTFLEAAESATSLLERAEALAWLDNWTEAGPLFAEAEKLFVASGDERNALDARIGRVRFESERMPYAEVSEFFATQLINPVVASDPHLKLWCLAAKGYTDLQIAPLSAKKAWEELMAIAQELGQRQWISRANGELGIIAFLEGDSGKAQRQVGQALQSARSSGDIAAQVRYLSMIGQGVAEIGRFQESLFYFDQALALANTHKDGPYPYIATSGKATALSALKQEPQARQLLTQALEKAKTLGRRGQETDLLRLLGILDEKSDNRAGAVHHYEEAISLATKGQFYRELADTLIRAAKIYQRDGSLDKAEQHAAHGVQVSRKVGDTYFLPRYLTALAEIKAALGKLQVAEALYDEAQDIIRGMLVFVPSLRMKSSLVAAMSDAYLSQFKTNVELLQNPSRAFQVIELARGRTIADVLRSRFLVQGSAPTPVMVQISSLQRRLIESTSRTERKSLVDEIDQAEILMAPETSALWRSRGYLQLADSPVSLEALRKTLSGRELILEYVLTEPNSYCLVVSRDNIQIVRLASGSVIEGNVERYVKEIQEKKVPTSLGQQIFKDLIAPIPNLRSRLIIVPDGKLNNLPFETLPVAPNQFLVHSHQILYCPSSTVLAAISSRAATKKQLAFLGVGDIPYGGEVAETATRGIEELQWKKLQPLPASREEVVTAGHLLGKQPVLLMGPKATEAAFKGQSLERYRVLHLALHGFADLTNPDRASLVFNLDPDPLQDGLLQAREIAGLNLKAELVTLSACNTAVGPMQAQEGIDNLVKAFLIAGARNVIASLWPAEDKFTLALMKQFYAHLAKGKDKAEALQLAKQALLAEFGNDLPPLYWAGFKLIGHGGTLAPGNK